MSVMYQMFTLHIKKLWLNDGFFWKILASHQSRGALFLFNFFFIQFQMHMFTDSVITLYYRIRPPHLISSFLLKSTQANETPPTAWLSHLFGLKWLSIGTYGWCHFHRHLCWNGNLKVIPYSPHVDSFLSISPA